MIKNAMPAVKPADLPLPTSDVLDLRDPARLSGDLFVVDSITTQQPTSHNMWNNAVVAAAKSEARVVQHSAAGVVLERYVFHVKTLVEHDHATDDFLMLVRRAAAGSAEEAARKAADAFIDEVNRTGRDPLDVTSLRS